MSRKWLWLVLALSACGGDPAAPAGQHGGSQTLSQHAGRWLLINYWAEWCKPCLEEVPHLNAFEREYPDLARVLAVNFDGLRGEALQSQARALGFEVPLLEDDPAPRFGYPRPQVLPTTVLIDPDGQVIRVLVGPQTDASLASAVTAARAGAVATP